MELFKDTFIYSMEHSYSFVPAIEDFCFSVYTPEYKDDLNKLIYEYELDSNIDVLLKEMSTINFDNYCHEDFTCEYGISLVHFDCYDFVNKHLFTADGYCLKKYLPYIKLIDYVFSYSNYKYLVPSIIKGVDDLSEAYKEMVERKKRHDEYDMMIK